MVGKHSKVNRELRVGSPRFTGIAVWSSGLRRRQFYGSYKHAASPIRGWFSFARRCNFIPAASVLHYPSYVFCKDESILVSAQ